MYERRKKNGDRSLATMIKLDPPSAFAERARAREREREREAAGRGIHQLASQVWLERRRTPQETADRSLTSQSIKRFNNGRPHKAAAATIRRQTRGAGDVTVSWRHRYFSK
jgi:hypothetical protein